MISLKRNSLGTVFANFALNRDNKRNVRLLGLLGERAQRARLTPV